MKKRLTVKDVLTAIDDDTKVMVTVYAYGIFYARTYEDGIFTAAECRERLRSDIMLGTVTSIYPSSWKDDEKKDVPCIGIHVEMIY